MVSINKSPILAKVVILLALVVGLIECGFGVKNYLITYNNEGCQIVSPNHTNAVLTIASVIPLVLLSLYLLKKPPQKPGLVVLSILGVIIALLLVSFAFWTSSWQGFCTGNPF